MSNLSQGVQILIERLKTHPEDFFGEIGNRYRGLEKNSPRFTGVEHRLAEMVNDKLSARMDTSRPSPYWFMTDEERTALIAAYTEACRLRFDAEMVHQLLTKPEEPDYGVAAAQYGQNLVSSLKTSQNAIKASVLNTAFTNTEGYVVHTGSSK